MITLNRLLLLLLLVVVVVVRKKQKTKQNKKIDGKKYQDSKSRVYVLVIKPEMGSKY